MKKILLFLCFILLAACSKKEKTKTAAAPLVEKPFVIIIPSYNNADYCEQNLLSVLSQNYKNFRVIYIDDASTDTTYEKVKEIIARSPLKERIELIHNTENQGALKNLYTAIHTCKEEEIVATVDGDDFLAHPHVLKTLNKVYADPEVWMTYGNYLDYPTYVQNPQICRPLSQTAIKQNAFRTHPWVSSHLRTFYAGLFKKIAKNDLLLEGKFLPMGWDLAFMLPLLEMSGTHTRFIKEILYLYNRSNPINDHKVNLTLQKKCADYVREQKPYAPLPELPR